MEIDHKAIQTATKTLEFVTSTETQTRAKVQTQCLLSALGGKPSRDKGRLTYFHILRALVMERCRD